MATSPVIAPDAAPTPVTWPSLNFSTASQASVAAQVATNVVTMTMAAELPAASAEPPLKAYQPAHSRPAPSSVSGTLCGLRSLPEARGLAQHDRDGQRGGAGVDVHRGAAGEVDGLELVGDPAADRRSRVTTPSNANTQCATGKYTSTAHTVGEDHPGAELHPVGGRAGDQRDGDRREQRLEQREQADRQAVDRGLRLERGPSCRRIR